MHRRYRRYNITTLKEVPCYRTRLNGILAKCVHTTDGMQALGVLQYATGEFPRHEIGLDKGLTAWTARLCHALKSYTNSNSSILLFGKEFK